MRSLSIRAGLCLNELFGRKRGKVVRDRYHRRDLFTALQVRRVLRYVLLNGHKHGVVSSGNVAQAAFRRRGWAAERSRSHRNAADSRARHTVLD